MAMKSSIRGLPALTRGIQSSGRIAQKSLIIPTPRTSGFHTSSASFLVVGEKFSSA
jgi:hypothetical protein